MLRWVDARDEFVGRRPGSLLPVTTEQFPYALRVRRSAWSKPIGEPASDALNGRLPAAHGIEGFVPQLANGLAPAACEVGYELLRPMDVAIAGQSWSGKQDHTALVLADVSTYRRQICEQLSPFRDGVVHSLSPSDHVKVREMAERNYLLRLLGLREVTRDNGIEARESCLAVEHPVGRGLFRQPTVPVVQVPPLKAAIDMARLEPGWLGESLIEEKAYPLRRPQARSGHEGATPARMRPRSPSR